MYFSRCLAVASVTNLILAYPHANLRNRQDAPQNPIPFDITMCKDYGGSVCDLFHSYSLPPQDPNSDHNIASNAAVMVNTATVNGISALQVSAAGVKCTFGNTILSNGPGGVICGGFTVDVTSDQKQVSIGNTVLNDNVQCYYCWAT